MKDPEPITKYMATKLVTFRPDDDIRRAIRSLIKYNITGAPVTDHKGNLVGIISEKDCLRILIEGTYHQHPSGSGTVGDYMSKEVTTISVDKNILDAAQQFYGCPYRRFPVLDGNKLVGLISRRDVLRAIDMMKPHVEHVPSSWKARKPE
jgi:CBS domain-containing protein